MNVYRSIFQLSYVSFTGRTSKGFEYIIPRESVTHVISINKAEELRDELIVAKDYIEPSIRKSPTPHKWIKPTWIGQKEFADKRSLYKLSL
jgi:hypothetical protein